MVHAIIERKIAGDSLALLNYVVRSRPVTRDFPRHNRAAVEMSENVVQLPKPNDWTLIHAYFANMGGMQVKLNYSGTASSSERRLNTSQIAEAFWMRFFTNIQSIQRKDIEFRSKSDLFAKALALLQILWLVASLITRAVQKLAVTQLEIVTVAFAACTFVTYFFCFQKPQDAQIPVFLGELQVPSSLDEEHLISLQSTSLARYLLNPNSPPTNKWLERIPDDNFYPSMSTLQPVGPILCLATVGCDNVA